MSDRQPKLEAGLAASCDEPCQCHGQFAARGQCKCCTPDRPFADPGATVDLYAAGRRDALSDVERIIGELALGWHNSSPDEKPCAMEATDQILAAIRKAANHE